MRRRTALALALLGAAFLGVALHVGAADVSVTVTGCTSSQWQFSPRSVNVEEGDVVTFSNPSAVSGCAEAPHTATSTASPPAWDTGNVPVGSSASVLMDEAGTFAYRCIYHGAMTGTITVRAAEADLPPSVSILTPTEGALLEPGIVRVGGAASDDTTSVSLVIDGAAPQAANGTTTWTFDWDTSGLPVGSSHTLQAVASDGRQLGNSQPVHVTLARPDAGPQVAIYSPRPSATVSGVVVVNGTAADDRGLQRVEIRLDAEDWRPATGTYEWRFTWDTREVVDGTHVLEARVTDTGGHVAFAPSVAVSVRNAAPVVDAEEDEPLPPPANAPPAIGAHRPAEGETVSGAVAFRVPASDPDRDALTLQLRIDGELVLTSAPPLVYTWPAYLAEPGRHVAVALACDPRDCSSRLWNFTVAGTEVPVVGDAPATEPPRDPPDERVTQTKPSPAPLAALAILAALLRRRRGPSL